MMHRREFLRRSALIAAGVVAADQIDLLEMLAPRRLFASVVTTDWNVMPPGVFNLDSATFDLIYQRACRSRNTFLYTSDLGGGSLLT